MQGKERTFTPEVEKVWNKDYQCEYYRGVIIDGEDNIVERCTRTHASYDAALDEAKKKMAYSPLYYRQAGADIKEKLEEYKKKKAIEEKKMPWLFLILRNLVNGSICMNRKMAEYCTGSDIKIR